MKAILPNRRGAIVNLASYGPYYAFRYIAPYAALKGAVAQLTRALALEAAPNGIRVNAVGAGNVTNLLNSFRDDGRAFLADHGGQVGSCAGGSPEPDFEAQARLAFANLEVTLKAGGCTLEDIFDVTSFHPDPAEQIGKP